MATTTASMGRSWQMLQELAGLNTPFTERVREKSEAEIAQEHQAALAAQKQEYEEQLAKARGEVQAELAIRLQRRLADLAAKGAADRRQQPGEEITP